MLTHACIPHKSPEQSAITRQIAHFMCGLMFNLVICKQGKKSVVKNATECLYRDHVSLNNTNSKHWFMLVLWMLTCNSYEVSVGNHVIKVGRKLRLQDPNWIVLSSRSGKISSTREFMLGVSILKLTKSVKGRFLEKQNWFVLACIFSRLAQQWRRHFIT